MGENMEVLPIAPSYVRGFREMHPGLRHDEVASRYVLGFAPAAFGHVGLFAEFIARSRL